ncbi:MAG: hypothetical protein O3B01_29095 [Planctomycetota bacterium]|nr:hypothetical protein [Planctomycetota bacterium]MDA1142640.1 hypothetical protein [Planctomycetota bacterium]
MSDCRLREPEQNRTYVNDAPTQSASWSGELEFLADHAFGGLALSGLFTVIFHHLGQGIEQVSIRLFKAIAF